MNSDAAARYALKFDGGEPAGEQTVSFHAHSTSGALEVAMREARGDWAELSRDGTLVCKMTLVSETGVWLVAAADGNVSNVAAVQ